MVERLDKQIPREPVASGHIASLGWLQIPYGEGPDLGILDVAFRTGNIYRFYDVPRAAYDALRDAPSVGTAFNRSIKSAGFPVAQIRTITKAA